MGDFLDEAAIRRKLRWEALQHPLTILPLALGCLSTVYLVFCADILGGTAVASAVTALSGIVATGSFFFRHSCLYRKEYHSRVNEVLERQRRSQREREQAEIDRLVDLTQVGFSEIESTKGLRALAGLVREHRELQRVLNHRRDADLLSMAQVSTLAEETFRRGLQVLADVLEIERVTVPSDQERLEADIKAYEGEIGSLEAKGTATPLLEIKKDTLALHRERLELVSQQAVRVGKLLYQCGRCETSLQRTRIELSALKTGNAEMSISAVTDTLQRTIQQAQEIQEELQTLGF
jgi:hypothetical protein